VDLKDIPGTGKEGRVLKEAILSYVNGRRSAPPEAAKRPTPAAAEPKPTVTHASEQIAKPLPVYVALPDS